MLAIPKKQKQRGSRADLKFLFPEYACKTNG